MAAFLPLELAARRRESTELESRRRSAQNRAWAPAAMSHMHGESFFESDHEG